jgi:hypothetical protein
VRVCCSRLVSRCQSGDSILLSDGDCELGSPYLVDNWRNILCVLDTCSSRLAHAGLTWFYKLQLPPATRCILGSYS